MITKKLILSSLIKMSFKRALNYLIRVELKPERGKDEELKRGLLLLLRRKGALLK